MKINKNNLCPCNSGKIFKKCCASKKKQDTVFFDPFVHYIRNNNAIDLLEFVSFLQLMPENSSKIIRLEKIQQITIENLHSNFTDKKNDYKVLKKIFDVQFNDDMEEDPNEGCFSENIIFLNGNNIVFPGIATNCTETNQLILNSIFLNPNMLDAEFVNTVEEFTIFYLIIFNQIAERLGVKRYEYIENYRDKIILPDVQKFETHKGIFTFTEERISQIINSLGIKSVPLQDLSIDAKKIKYIKGQETDLIKKPFIKYEDKFYLALPSSQMFSFNCYLIDKIKKFNCVKDFEKTYYETVKMQGDLELKKMGWKCSLTSIDLGFDCELWEFDSDKFAFVHYKKEESENFGLYKKMENFITESKIYKYILLTLTTNYNLEKRFYIKQSNLPFFKYQILLSIHDLKRLNILWSLKKLDLWKYLKAKERSEKKGLELSPFFTVLTYFSYFKRNEKSFLNIDDHTPDYIHFTYDIQGSRVIESLQKEDLHAAIFFTNYKEIGYFPVRKYNELKHAPLYLADVIYVGAFKLLLEKYSFPIWISSHKQYDIECKYFVEAISFWLNELHHRLEKLIGEVPNIPIVIDVKLHDDFYQYISEELDEPNINYLEFKTVTNNLNTIEITIPAVMNIFIAQDNNAGERKLIKTIIHELISLFNIVYKKNIQGDRIDEIINQVMPLGMAKMLIANSVKRDVTVDNRFINNNISRLNKADTSIVLEDMISWMNIEIPNEIPTKEEKIIVCIEGIDTLIKKIRETVSEFDCVGLLIDIIMRYETILNINAFKSMRTVAYDECFRKYNDITKDLLKEDSKNIRTSLCLRALIEFIVAEPYYGNKQINDDEIDFLVALVDELIFLGTTKDLINFDLDNPVMGKLDSGRLGISKDYYEKINDFSLEVKKDDHFEQIESYNNKDETSERNDDYYDNLDSVFKDEFGIELFKLRALMVELASFCFEKGNSYLNLHYDEFIAILKNEFKLDEIEINSILNHFVLDSRGNFGKPPKGFDYPDIFPWRYNRKLSYMSKPFLKIKDDNDDIKIIYSARHLVSSIDNFFALFLNGGLKISSSYKQINILLSQRNNIKGKQFRNDVCAWLTNNTELDVIQHEFKIPVKGNKKNYGDVDILAFDKHNKKILSIECKNTKQAKIIYEFQRDAKNYINKQLPKHNERTKWLIDNLTFLSDKFNYDLSDFKVEPYLISSFKLPLKLVQNIENISILSFNEIKQRKKLN